MSGTPRRQPAPTWVTEAVGSVREAERVRWGFTNESWLVATKSGRALVATRMTDPAAARLVLQRGPAISLALAGVGIAMPIPIPETSAPERAVVVSAFIPGRSGMELIGDAQGAERVGRLVGRAWLALGRVETAWLGLDDLWARPNALAAATERWLAAAGRTVHPDVASGVGRRIEQLPQLLAERRPGFVHGDLVPANVLVESDELAALLDLEAVRVGERLLDAAWFRWIVRYHHRELERDAWRGFADGSGIDEADPTIGTILDVLPILRILEILDQSALGAAARARWLDQLHACARWPGARG
jgi:Ser/Thr protein kinase RdoA (MazF antagonist)